MVLSGRAGRRVVAGLIGSAAVGSAMLLGGASPALAQPAPAPPPPNCTAADLAQVSGSVGTAMGIYLFTHPDVNNFFTGLRGKPDDEIRGAVQTYMNANPMVESEINAIRQPLKDLRTRCDAVEPAP
ncbi:MAG: heme-binding protein [Mycolicibacterium sp.]|uniref:heme-binding protein n=1 Tax=Mycolicibacterium sp. TaxID=2320850 RepID=UPI003D133A30